LPNLALVKTNASYDPLAKVFRNLATGLGANEDGTKDVQVIAKKFRQKYAQWFRRKSDSKIVSPGGGGQMQKNGCCHSLLHH
jgi:hypothetical protein